MRAAGIEVSPDGIEGNDGHAIVNGIVYAQKKSPWVVEATQRLATELTFEVRDASGNLSRPAECFRRYRMRFLSIKRASP